MRTLLGKWFVIICLIIAVGFWVMNMRNSYLASMLQEPSQKMDEQVTDQFITKHVGQMQINLLAGDSFVMQTNQFVPKSDKEAVNRTWICLNQTRFLYAQYTEFTLSVAQNKLPPKQLLLNYVNVWKQSFSLKEITTDLKDENQELRFHGKFLENNHEIVVLAIYSYQSPLRKLLVLRLPVGDQTYFTQVDQSIHFDL